ncbi:XRE family transcriptional regulator [Castellaniella caeni]|uniref:XRE family transcriptional regulator n=1 Tax=Castellaniella caeni TaxID=266123 RepID=UPI000C9EC924|nr:S24 family peptidase [Castellaniella caeni]
MATTLSQRLKEVLAGYPRGTQKDMADVVGVSTSAVSQWVKGDTKSLSSENLLKVAKFLNVTPEWLLDGKGSPLPKDPTREDAPPPPTTKNGEIKINRFDTGGAMGSGLELPDQPGVIESVRVSREWLQKNVRAHTAASNLRIVTGFGDSMQPLFNSGDPLIVDCGVKVVEFDAIYFFRVDNQGFVKRLQRVPTLDGLTIKVISENARYDPWPIVSGMDFEVFGRVLKVWESKDF